MKEPPIVAVYRDCTGLDTRCDTCKFSGETWMDEPCGDCTGRHCGYEPIEGWEGEQREHRQCGA